jgi:hypothetical protein
MWTQKPSGPTNPISINPKWLKMTPLLHRIRINPKRVIYHITAGDPRPLRCLRDRVADVCAIWDGPTMRHIGLRGRHSIHL